MTDTLYMHRGNSAQWTFTVRNDSDGTVRDLTGASNVQFLVKRKAGDADTSAVITGTAAVTDAANGTVTVSVAPADSVNLTPGTYYWGLQFKEQSGQLWELPKPQDGPGRLKLTGDIVRATP